MDDAAGELFEGGDRGACARWRTEGRAMRMALVLLVAILALTGCTMPGARVTPTVPPTVAYSGARLQGYPTPGRLSVVRDDTLGIELRVIGTLAATVDAYHAAWLADGWRETQRDDQVYTITLLFSHAGVTRRIVFATTALPEQPKTSVRIDLYELGPG